VGAGLAEAPWVWGQRPQALMQKVLCEQDRLLHELATAGRPVLFLTPHLGSFEVTARAFAAHGRITVLYREPTSALLKSFMAKARQTDNMKAAPAKLGGIKTMLKALRAGEAVGILPDQVPSAGEGEWIAFFGKPAYTMVLPQRLASTTQARVVLAVGIPLSRAEGRLTGHYWRLHLEEMLEAPSPENINKRFEQLILSMPHLYLWGYNRYKHPAGAPLPPGGLEKHRHDHA
jgi:Kdo2-lipid IVA lauroyltransferase/acyltransferase